MKTDAENKKELSEEELAGITGGAAVEKAQMMQLTCEKCGKKFFANIKKRRVFCKHCREHYDIDG